MAVIDLYYNGLVKEIMNHGVLEDPSLVRTRWADGSPANYKSIFDTKISFDTRLEGVPILTSKFVAPKTAIAEMFAFWVQRTNKIEDMHKLGVKIWDQWEIKEGIWKGTIGPAYGYQLGKPCRMINGKLVDQVEWLIHSLKVNRASRRLVVSLWDVNMLDNMALEPCVWNTTWRVIEDTLHLKVGIRSSDVAVGLPFNMFQYYVLMRMIAHVTGYKTGKISFDIADAHIYDRHLETIEKQLKTANSFEYSSPSLHINPDVKNFFDFTLDDISIIGYENNNGGKIQYEVAE